MFYFTNEIKDWATWSKVFHDSRAFSPLVKHILSLEGLPLCELGELTPGTNGVFRCGDYVVKVFAPSSSGVDSTRDIATELFSTARANSLGVGAPALVASGVVHDQYEFHYIITEYIPGTAFADAAHAMTPAEKSRVGQALRAITDRLNTPCEDFNGVDVLHDPDRWKRWREYPERFQKERAAYLMSRDFGEPVFVHGDINPDNLLITEKGALKLIDFADAVRAPICYEHAPVAVDLFCFDRDFLEGYFGGITDAALLDLCFHGILIHDFGGGMVKYHLADPNEVQSLSDLEMAIKRKMA